LKCRFRDGRGSRHAGWSHEDKNSIDYRDGSGGGWGRKQKRTIWTFPDSGNLAAKLWLLCEVYKKENQQRGKKTRGEEDVRPQGEAEMKDPRTGSI